MFWKNQISEESKLLVQEYAKNPINNHKMKNPTISQHEWNFVCGDDITIYLKIKNNKIEDFSFDGNCSTITTASASFLAEMIINTNLDEILKWNYKTFTKQWFIVSNKRKRAVVIALVWVQNAIHKYNNTNKIIELEDLIDE